MNLSVGIVGLPNVGKSTLFNALLKKQQALAANYPFATIEPNVGVVAVPDERLQKLAEITAMELAWPAVREPHPDPLLRGEGIKKENFFKGEGMKFPPIKPATVEFVDIAGLVKGASEGAGLGNKFLSHIREVRIIAHVVRVFTDEDVVREGSIDPESDYKTIQTELLLADLNTISKIKDQKSKTQIKGQKEIAQKIFEALNKGIPAREVPLADEEKEIAEQFFLLSAKPEIVVLNVAEEDYTAEKIPEVIKKYSECIGEIASPVASGRPPRNDKSGDGNFVVICAKIESELSELSEEEQREYLKGLGLKQSGLEQLIEKAYKTLGLISFLTAGEKEVRAWTIKKGTSAQMAAGEIHTDFIKKFIKAEVVGYEDFITVGGWKKAREIGKARQEGRDYIIKDGDVVEFKIGT